MDLRGRAVRTSAFQDPEGQSFKAGDKVEIRCDGFNINSNHVEIQINNSEVASVMREGDVVFLGDNGQVFGHVVETARTSFVLEIKSAGKVRSHSLVKIPGSRYQQLPVLTKEDKADIQEVAAKHKFDYIVIPTVQTGRDIQEVKLSLGADAKNIQVAAKIDTIEAVQNFVGILKQADAIVILRNELTLELEPEKLVLA